MSRASLLLLLLPGLWAQTADNPLEKAPPDVDQALRARITGFYQAHVDRKLIRKADQYVAEDTKDFFFEANKPTYLEFEIDKIIYSENFTRAKAIVKAKMTVPMPGFGDHPMVLPVPGDWKIENGEWCWYVDQKIGRDTPFGRLPPAGG